MMWHAALSHPGVYTPSAINKWIRKPEEKQAEAQFLRRNNRKTTAVMDQTMPNPRPPLSVRCYAERITSWPERRGDYSAPSVCYSWHLSIDAMIGRALNPCPAAVFTTVSCCRWSQEAPQAISALNSSMMMEYNTPGKYFPAMTQIFQEKAKIALKWWWNFSPLKCVVFSQRVKKKKKTVPVFFPSSNLGWGVQRMCSKVCLLHKQLYFAISSLRVAVLSFESNPPIPTAHPPHWETVNLLFPLWLKNMHTQNRLVTASATCFHKGLCHLLARHETSEETVCGLLDFCTLAETCTVQMWKKQKHAEVP